MTAPVFRVHRSVWMIGFIAACVVCAGPQPAAAQSASDLPTLTQKVERLQRDLNLVQRQVYGGESPPSGESANLSAGATGGGAMSQAAAQHLSSRLSALEQEMQRMTGRIEETEHAVRQLGNRMDKLAQDVDYRLTELERASGSANSKAGTAGEPQTSAGAQSQQGKRSSEQRNAGDGGPAGGASGNTPKTLGTVPEEAVEALRKNRSEQANGGGSAGETQSASTPPSGDYDLPEGSTAEQYEYAFGMLRQANYDEAERALAAFLEAHPDDALAGNAKYWLGETYYVRGNYDQAAVTFAEGFQNYPDSQKAPDNLLKLGMSLAQIDRDEDACGIFAELKSRYSDAANNILQRAERERQRLECDG